MPLSVIFIGSFQKHSRHVLETLLGTKSNDHLFTISGVITSPPSPKDRGLALAKTAVHEYAEGYHLPVFTPETLDEPELQSLKARVSQPDFLVVAGFGKLLPPAWLAFPKIAAVNLHPSLLPKYRGRFPAEWAILNNEPETGVTLLEMSERFDHGKIISQGKLTLSPHDTREVLYQKLFTQGGKVLCDILPRLASGQIAPLSQPDGPLFYARGLTREDGFVPWDLLQLAISGQSVTTDTTTPLFREIATHEKTDTVPLSSYVDRSIRALSPWPGVWTLTPVNKRLKILSADYNPVSRTLTPTLVQEESKKPKLWKP